MVPIRNAMKPIVPPPLSPLLAQRIEAPLACQLNNLAELAGVVLAKADYQLLLEGITRLVLAVSLSQGGIALLSGVALDSGIDVGGDDGSFSCRLNPSQSSPEGIATACQLLTHVPLLCSHAPSVSDCLPS